jgi:type I restriction enzyme S subunit
MSSIAAKAPAKWEYKAVGAFCKTTSGGTPTRSKKEYYDSGTIPWLLSGEVCQKEIESVKNTITDAGLKNSSAKLFPVNSVLVAMYGATAGQAGILRCEAASNQAVCAIFPNPTYSPEFLYYFFVHAKSDLVAQAAGNAQPNLSQKKIRDTQVPVPPLPEQERIVAILDEAFEGIATATAHAERNLHNARELFQSVLQSTFQQKGEDWVETTLKDEVDFAAGFAFKSKGYVKNGEDGIRLLRGDNIMQGEFRWESAALWPSDDVEAYTKFHLEENDVVLAMDRPWVSAGLKISSVSSKDLPCLQVQRTARLRVGDKLSWQYLFHLLRSREFIDYILGGQTGLGVPHISGKQILSFHFGRPPIKQQKAIVQKLDALATETRRLEAIYQRKLAALAELKQSLLQRAFAGEL